ncbi:hypothetical protein HNQ69_001068 [Bartonella callosciuri]|uniref:Uncharacterized protein n=1 Tax=Bartonella callosciuri TaxID=686223 RepID=A0A840NVG6_9HYPH|nr:transcriptional regulator [Bartonella callosciuri]MBB5073935.1 hypothetical protein [Bartonella callosciuri]
MLGNEERGVFAQRFNLQRGTLGNYEIEAYEPPSLVINAYYTAYNINPHWHVRGEGGMFTDMTKAKAAGFKAPTISAGLMKKLGRVAYTICRDANIKILHENIVELAVELYRELQELVQNINDMEEVALTLPLLKLYSK